jgi:hypothetical protein
MMPLDVRDVNGDQAGMIYKFLAASIVLAAYGDSGRSLRKK